MSPGPPGADGLLAGTQSVSNCRLAGFPGPRRGNAGGSLERVARRTEGFGRSNPGSCVLLLPPSPLPLPLLLFFASSPKTQPNHVGLWFVLFFRSRERSQGFEFKHVVGVRDFMLSERRNILDKDYSRLQQ